MLVQVTRFKNRSMVYININYIVKIRVENNYLGVYLNDGSIESIDRDDIIKIINYEVTHQSNT